MFSAIRKRFTYANVAMTLALVFAMTGGAYAASKYVITSTKQISPKVLKSLKGANGKNGPAGPAGPAGAAGAGTAGAAGPQGPAGAKGETGKEGEKGKEGKTGKEGSPWTAGGTLPSGASETGVWGQTELPAEGGSLGLQIPISFTIPLKAALDEAHVHIFEGTTAPMGCSGTEFEGKLIELKAEPGNLCVYIEFQARLKATELVPLNLEKTAEPHGAGKTGTVLTNPIEVEIGANAKGEWVVTAP